MNDVSWSSEQNLIIEAKASQRLLIDAGPGTGKTAVACARIAHLINGHFCAPHNIIVVSFTNTAVYEIRERIKTYLTDSNLASNIKITTLDSFAGKLRLGFDSIQANPGSYTEGITRASKLIFSDPNVAEYVSEIEHVFIDESQDIVGERGLFILELLAKLQPNSGVTIFADEAQAIYGFTNDMPEETDLIETLPQLIRKYNEHFDVPFQQLQLNEIFRTKSGSNLNVLFTEGRRLIQKGNKNPEDVYDELRELILTVSDVELPDVSEVLGIVENEDEDSIQDFTDIFLIFRRRGEALQAANHLGLKQRRLRLSGLPVPIHPWVADVFWNFEDDEISESEFLLKFEKETSGKGYQIGAQAAWKLILRESGISDRRVSVRKLRVKLSRRSPTPDFTYADYGFGGPILSSIHASKGRETEGVLLFLPKKYIKKSATPEEILEEARVIFVGATRAKEEVLVFNGTEYSPVSALKTTGRAFSKISSKAKTARVEIGRLEDISAYSLVSEKLFPDYTDVITSQRFFRKFPFHTLELTAFGTSKDTNYQYRIVEKQTKINKQRNQKTLFHLDQNFNRDLWSISNLIGQGTKPPTFFTSFFSLGTRTLVIPPDDPSLDTLHTPWSESGFVHAPMVSGYPFIQFERRSY